MPLLTLVAFGLAAPAAAHAADPCPKVDETVAFPIRADRNVWEQSHNEKTTYTIDWTDRSGAHIGSGSVTLSTTKRVGADWISPIVQAPKTIRTADGKDTQVCDYTQTTQRIGHTGEVNVLNVEAITFDRTSSTFATADVFESLFVHAGLDRIAIPDLFADTNGDGSLGAGDLLYSAVDLNVFLTAHPAFAFDETFSIVNGLAPGLPGMFFSTTPITFDAATGAFDGTPATTDGTALSAHNMQLVTPEPATLALLVAGLFPAAAFGRRGRRA
jgi:hypothetical protein